MVSPQQEESEVPQIVNLSQICLETVEAGLVRANQSSIGQITSEEVDLQTSIAGTIQAEEVNVQDSIVGMLVSNQTRVENSIVAGIRAETLDFKGAAGLAIANSMSNTDLDAVAVIGNDVQAQTINTGLLICRKVQGNVTTTLDGKTALLAALAGGVMTGLIIFVGNLVFGRKK
jgi:hypothetical protein